MDYPAGFTPSFPEVVDSTMRSEFVACPRQMFEAFIMKRSLRGSSIHLVAGGAYAKGLEVVRTLVYGPERLRLDDAIAEAIPHVWAEFGDTPVPEGYEHKGPIAVVKGLIAYFDRYHPDRDHIKPMIKPDGMPAVEFSFTFPTGILHPTTGNPILYAGRFDAVVVYNDSFWVLDDKTASQLGTSWDRQWGLRGQLTGYAFAAQQHGIAAQGAIIRGTSFLKTGAFGFSEPIEYRAPWMIERWWVQLHRDIQRMVQCWNDKDETNPYGYWDYNLADACTSFGGCPFTSLCKVSNPDNWLQDYEYRDWSPLDKNPAGRKQIQSTMMRS